jgi:hypothetical protein
MSDQSLYETFHLLQAVAPELDTKLTHERLHLVKQLSSAYRAGWEKGVRDFAIWRNGEQLVGCLQRPLQTVLEEGPSHDR